ncbi:MAG: hypothetical protein JOZ41_10905 [Chloroflexi bacterium]|nr:hypothetical protein [Chloroflexota bacterium]
MELCELDEWVLRIIDAADRGAGMGRVARAEVIAWAGSQGLEPRAVGDTLAALERAGLIVPPGVTGGAPEEGGRFTELTDAGREWLLEHPGAAGLAEAPHEELVAADEERGEWAYRIAVPPGGRPWNVLIRRQLLHTTRRVRAPGSRELPYVTFYVWRCWRSTNGGEFTIDAHRIGRYPSTREEALATATSYILEYEETLAGGEGER